MENKHSSPFKDFTRGGQTTLHNVRMFGQIVKKLLILFLMVAINVDSYWIFSGVTRYHSHLQLLTTWCGAHTRILLGHERDKIELTLLDGRTYLVLPQDVVASPYMAHVIFELKSYAKQGFVYSGVIGLGVCTLTSLILHFVGRKQRRTTFLRGTILVTNKKLHHLLKRKQQVSDLTLSGVPLVKDSECTHFLISGAPGTGKSVCVSELLDQIRTKNQRAIVYDKTGDFVTHYFREGKDILLNPLDARSPPWNLWAECHHPSDFDMLATALIPSPASHSQDPFWINAARTLFSTVAFEMRKQNNISTKNLLHTLFTADLDYMSHLLKGTEAEALASEKIEKTALSIKSVLATTLKSFKYLQDSPTPFSIRHWLENQEEDRWLFITSRANQHETLKPLISAWLEIAGNTLLSLPPNNERRIWMSLDELPSLHRLTYLPAMLAESRKFGGCFITTLQSIAQLRDIYGMNGAEAISGLCSTRVFFRTPEAHTAEWVVKSLGECEVEDPREGLSYGANTVRDGVSINRQQVIRPLVLASEMTQLPNLQAFLKLPGNWPMTKLKFIPKIHPSCALAYCEKSCQEDTHENDEIKKMTTHIESKKSGASKSPQQDTMYEVDYGG